LWAVPRDNAFATAFLNELRRRGFIEGQNLKVEWREQQPGLFLQHAAELVQARVDVVTTAGDDAIRALQQATKPIPIVALTGDMLGRGFVNSLAHPDGNTTGVNILARALDGKRQEILIEAVPGLRRMAVLSNDYDATAWSAQLEALQRGAREHDIELSIYSHRQRRGDRGSDRQRAGIGRKSAKHSVVASLLHSSAPHYGPRRRDARAYNL
jgi:putative ABC transport system substrate-binding protein